MLSLAAASIAQTDVSAGGNRKAGMGGAGLALPVDIQLSGRMNPALFAHNKGYRVSLPQLGYELDGLTYNQARDILKKVENGGVTASTVGTLAKQYADARKEFGGSGGFALALDGLNISVDGAANVTSIPNASLATWSKAGATGLPPSDAQLDAYGFGYYATNFGYAKTVSDKEAKVDVGIQAKLINGYFSHYYVDATQLTTSSTMGLPATEMGGNSSLSNRSFGLDFGALVTLPTKGSRSFVGFTVQNLVEPKTSFLRTLPGQVQTSTPPLASTTFNPFARQFAVGFASQTDRTNFALDWVDLGNHAGVQALRAGFELNLNKGLSFRVGYDSRTKGTFGLSIGQLHVNFAEKNPFSLATGLKF